MVQNSSSHFGGFEVEDGHELRDIGLGYFIEEDFNLF